MSDKILLNSTELTEVLGKNEIYKAKHLEGKYHQIPKCKNCIDGGLE